MFAVAFENVIRPTNWKEKNPSYCMNTHRFRFVATEYRHKSMFEEIKSTQISK